MQKAWGNISISRNYAGLVGDVIMGIGNPSSAMDYRSCHFASLGSVSSPVKWVLLGTVHRAERGFKDIVYGKDLFWFKVGPWLCTYMSLCVSACVGMGGTHGFLPSF